MTRASNMNSSAPLLRFAGLLVAVAALGLAGCNYEGGDPRKPSHMATIAIKATAISITR